MALEEPLLGDGVLDDYEGYEGEEVDGEGSGGGGSGAGLDNDYMDNDALPADEEYDDQFQENYHHHDSGAGNMLSTPPPFGDTIGGNNRISSMPPQEPMLKQPVGGTRDRWEQKTLEGLNHAKALQKQALKSLMDTDNVRGHAKRQLHANTAVVSHTIKKKIVGTEDLIKALDDRVESVEDTIRQVGECLFQLQRAHRSKWAPLNVCERRLQLRDARPPQELIRDACQEALEHERQTLIESRQELSDQIDSMKEMLVTLDKVKGELIEDMQHKRHALRIDRHCLSPKKPVSARQIQDRLVLPSLQEVMHYGMPPSPKNTQTGTGQQHEESRQLSTRELLAKAVRCEEDAMRLANESDACMIHTKRECTRACNQAQTELMRRVDETLTLRKQLEIQIQETDETITQTELSMAKTKKKLESHEQPLRALNKQFAMRSARTSREEIRDPVHDEMEGHLDTVKRNVKALVDKLQATKDLLEQLKSSRQRMQEDLRCKCTAQKIDDSCIKVTPKKAIELDRMDPRGGRCREPSIRRKQQYGGNQAMYHEIIT